MVRKQKINLFFFSLLISAVLSGCLKSGGGASSENPGDSQGSGGSGGGTDDLPIPISGTNIIRKLRVGNGRVLCTSKSNGRTYNFDSSYQLNCQAAVVDEVGNQQVANAIEEGVRVKWKEPVRISGAEILSKRCQVSESQLDQECNVIVQGSAGVPTEIKVDLDLHDTKTNQSSTEFSLFYLPFSVESFGFVPQVPGIFSSNKTVDASKGTGAVSYLNSRLDPLNTYFGEIRSACELGSRTYFEAGGLIYALEGGFVRLFAGSGNPNLANEYTHPLRTFFISNSIRMACVDDVFYVLDANRIFRLTDTSITPVNFDPTSLAHQDLNANGGTSISIDTTKPKEPGFAVADARHFYVSDSQGILKIAWDPIPAGAYQKTMLRMGSNADSNEDIVLGDGCLYVVEKQGAQIRKIPLSNGTTSVMTTGFTSLPSPTDAFPRGIAYNPDGTLYLSDTKGARIVRLNSEGLITNVPLSGGALTSPRGLTRTSNGSLLIADGSYLKRLEPNGELRTLAGLPKPSIPENGAKAETSSIDGVSGMVVLPSKEIIFNEGHFLRRITSDGKVIGIAGSGSSYENQIPATLSALGWTDSSAVAPDGTLYFTVGNQIKKIDPNGILSTVAGQADSASLLNSPNPDRILYFELWSGAIGLARVPVFSFSTMVSPLNKDTNTFNDCYGNAVPPGNVPNFMTNSILCTEEGDALTATLKRPRGLVLEADGRTLYVADSLNQRIRKILPNGKIYTLLGPLVSYPTDITQGMYVNAFQYNPRKPNGLVLTNDRKLYFGEVGHEINASGFIRKLDLSNGRITAVAGTGSTAVTAMSANETDDAFGSTLKPGAMALGPDGKIYFVDQKFSLVRSLEPYNTSGMTMYKLRNVFGLNQTKDCGGGIASGNASRESLDSAVKTSLNSMCAGYPGSVAIRSNCGTREGSVVMAISQTFSGTSATSGNIIRIERPCGAADIH